MNYRLIRGRSVKREINILYYCQWKNEIIIRKFYTYIKMFAPTMCCKITTGVYCTFRIYSTIYIYFILYAYALFRQSSLASSDEIDLKTRANSGQARNDGIAASRSRLSNATATRMSRVNRNDVDAWEWTKGVAAQYGMRSTLDFSFTLVTIYYISLDYLSLSVCRGIIKINRNFLK